MFDALCIQVKRLNSKGRPKVRPFFNIFIDLKKKLIF